jgi:hypothetical protein
VDELYESVLVHLKVCVVSFCRYVYKECAAGPLLPTRHQNSLAHALILHLFLIASIRSPPHRIKRLITIPCIHCTSLKCATRLL